MEKLSNNKLKSTPNQKEAIKFQNLLDFSIYNLLGSFWNLMASFWLGVLFNLLFDSFSITHKDRKSIENLKNREFESLRPRVWREIAEKIRKLEKTASLRGISVYIHNGKISIYHLKSVHIMNF